MDFPPFHFPGVGFSFRLATPQKRIDPVCFCGLTSPCTLTKKAAFRSIGQSDTFNIRRACGLIRHDPERASELISEPLAAGGNCRRHDLYIGIMIHPYDTATHRNGRGANPVELPSRPKAH